MFNVLITGPLLPKPQGIEDIFVTTLHNMCILACVFPESPAACVNISSV